MTAARRPGGDWSIVRALLAVVAVEIIVVSVPALLGDEQATSPHAARHLGAFAVAYGVGLLVVVARPARARTMLPVAAVLAGALVISASSTSSNGASPSSTRPPTSRRSSASCSCGCSPCRRGVRATGAVSARYSIVTVVVPPTDSNSPVRTRIVSSQLPAKPRSAFAW